MENNVNVLSAFLGDLKGVKFYIEEENIDVDVDIEVGFTALHEASSRGRVNIVNYLISKGANVNAVGNYRNDPIFCCHNEFDFITPLARAVSGGHIEVAKILIQNGAKTDVVVDSRNLLDRAIYSRNPEMIDLVMSHGFDINQHNYLGLTPLATAMSLEAYESIRFLLENGADYKKTSTSDGFLPIYYAIRYGLKSVRCIELLLKHIEKKEGRKGIVDHINRNDNSKGFTVLHEACRRENYDVVKLFLECGSDISIRDKKGEMPYDLLPSRRVSRVCEEIKALFDLNKHHSR